ncbi:GL25336 [Drosophila persimilis]|uniref:GL25336 n=1 Tax=Drosophila persimilis TaxID=7234 RepID=B4GU34_DROPE|nr:GL25336 [Drosophila persimilis]
MSTKLSSYRYMATAQCESHSDCDCDLEWDWDWDWEESRLGDWDSGGSTVHHLSDQYDYEYEYEKIDPLTRIQEEIKEVVRREEEYRQLATLSSTGGGAATPPPIQVDEFETYTINGNGNDFGQDQEPQGQEQLLDLGEDEEEQDQGRGVLVTAQPALAAVQTTALLLPIDEHSNTPSLASSVNSTKEESLDGQHSDDSGISASSQSNNNNNNSNNLVKQLQPLKLTVVSRQEQRYIGPNCYNLTSEPPQQKLMTRTSPRRQEIVHNSQRMTCGYAYIMANGSGNGNGNGNGSASCNGGMRPAMSLAQLCDLTPEEAPSSHRLIAQWESLIKKNAEGGAAIEAVI